MASHLTSAEQIAPAQDCITNRSRDRKVKLARPRGAIHPRSARELRRNGCGTRILRLSKPQRQAERRRRQRPPGAEDGPSPEHQPGRRASGSPEEWAPQQIAGRMKEQDCDRRVSHQTIYAWIKQDPDRQHWESLLRRRGKRTWRRKHTAPTPDAARIRQSSSLKSSNSGCDWATSEGDTVLGAARTGGNVLVCRKCARLTTVAQGSPKERRPRACESQATAAGIGRNHRRSITFDNGTEFARCGRLEKHLDMALYFADPGFIRIKRGTNENTNGPEEIRQYFPKGTDFRDISHAEVRPGGKPDSTTARACLNFRTPAEVFLRGKIRPPKVTPLRLETAGGYSPRLPRSLDGHDTLALASRRA